MRIFLKKTILTALGGIIALCTAQANAALVVVETDDFENNTINPEIQPGDPSTFVGVLENGANIISGSISAECIRAGRVDLCGPFSGIGRSYPISTSRTDFRDVISFELPIGGLITGATLETVRTDGTLDRLYLEWTGVITTTQNYDSVIDLRQGAVSPLTSGLFVLAINGYHSGGLVIEDMIGFDWTLTLNVEGIEPASEVPLPAAAWFMGIGIAAFGASKRRSSLAKENNNV